MSELDSDYLAEMAVIVQPVDTTAGRMLREAREEKGLTASALAALMKVSLKKIEAIETDRFDLLPDMVFARAFALSICRNLKIDADPILKHFPPSMAHHLKSDESGINTPFRATQSVSMFKLGHALNRPVALFFAVVLLVVSFLYFYPDIYRAKTGVAQPEEITQNNTSPVASEKVMPFNAPIVGAASEATLPRTLDPAVTLLNQSVEGAFVSASEGHIVFKSRGVTWVEVIDAKGAVLLRKTLAVGEIVGASGALPLMVVVGKADAVDVSVAGKPFNLIAATKENIARFEVK